MGADEQVKNKIEKTLRKEFNENSTIDVSNGFRDNVHIVVVSWKFTGKSEKKKQEMLWSIIENSDLSESEKNKISLLLPFSPEELK